MKLQGGDLCPRLQHSATLSMRHAKGMLGILPNADRCASEACGFGRLSDNQMTPIKISLIWPLQRQGR
jgi:hypothetical protein